MVNRLRLPVATARRRRSNSWRQEGTQQLNSPRRRRSRNMARPADTVLPHPQQPPVLPQHLPQRLVLTRRVPSNKQHSRLPMQTKLIRLLQQGEAMGPSRRRRRSRNMERRSRSPALRSMRHTDSSPRQLPSRQQATGNRAMAKPQQQQRMEQQVPLILTQRSMLRLVRSSRRRDTHSNRQQRLMVQRRRRPAVILSRRREVTANSSDTSLTS